MKISGYETRISLRKRYVSKVFQSIMGEELYSQRVTAVPSGVDDAVGLEKSHWYVAIVNSRHEKSTSAKLENIGIESYVATQSEVHVWRNGRHKKVERVVIPSVVFVHCTESERRQLVTLPYINRFMVNRTLPSSVSTLRHPVAIVSDREMAMLRFMLGQSDVPVTLTTQTFAKGDAVRVLRGSLRGLEGVIDRQPDGTHTLTISISPLGGATVKISPSDVEKI